MATRSKQTIANPVHYLAGIIDADGCISISKMKVGRQRTKTPRYVLTVNVVNTSLTLMEWLVENFGGRYKARRMSSPNHKTTYDWWFNNGKALGLLETVGPHLLIKKEQARNGIELIRNWQLVRGRGATTKAKEVRRRESLYQRMKVLNRTGCAAATTKSSGPCIQQGDAIV